MTTMIRTNAIKILSLATLLTAALGASAQVPETNPAAAGSGYAPLGTLNYVEGHAALEGRAVPPNYNREGIRLPVMGEGQTVSTADGRVEILLTPGVFLRLDHDSTVKMISPNLTRTEVEVDRGRAELEVDALYKQNDLLVDEGQTQTKVLEHGLYEFAGLNAGNSLKVFEGKAAVSQTQDAKWVDVKGGHELALNGTAQKTEHFDKTEAQDELYSWSSLRAEYLGQANASLLRSEYAGAQGFYPGWAWDPGFYGYTWLPGDGFLYSPFGFGFYSPAFFYGGGFGYGYRGGYRGVYSGGIRGGYASNGFHGGAVGGGGRFHGGGGHR